MKIKRYKEEFFKEVHLRDLVKNIFLINIFDDVKDFHYYSECLDEEEDLVKEDEYLFYSDSQLKELSLDIIRAFTNLELLDRLYKIDKELLTDAQINILRDKYKQKVIVDKKDVEDIISKLKQCKRVNIADRPKNTLFAKKYNLSNEEYKEIIDHIEVKDYHSSTKDFSLEHMGNNLIIFQLSGMKLSTGKSLESIYLYVKLNLDMTDNEAVAAISFHDTNRINNRPYEKLNEKHIHEIILYDEDGSKLVLSGDALNMTPCKSTNINDLMKELFE